MALFRIFSVIAFFLISVSGCLRYTPSRAELSAENSSMESAEAFYTFEQSQRERLAALVQARLSEKGDSGVDEYRIGAGDVLELNVFDVAELNTSVRVRPSGFISLSLLGAVEVAGMTEGEVQEAIRKRLGDYLQAPQVSVFIAEYAAHQVSVIGEVAKPGAYPLKRSNYSLIELLSEAGGRTEQASGRVLLVPHGGSATVASKKVTAPVDGTSGRARLKDDVTSHGIEIYFDELVGSVDRPPTVVPLRAGDTIVVPESGTVEVDGEINKPGSYQLSSRMTLLGAVASAGGLTYSADVDSVEIIRELENGRKASISANMEKLASGEGKDIRLRDGDVIRVPSEPSRFATRQIVEGLNRLISFGVTAKPGP